MAFILQIGDYFFLNLNSVLNPILPSAWLDIHALTLKRNTEKYYFGEKSSFWHTFQKFVVNQGKVSQVSML
jgi:hypothetical protein